MGKLDELKAVRDKVTDKEAKDALTDAIVIIEGEREGLRLLKSKMGEVTWVSNELDKILGV